MEQELEQIEGTVEDIIYENTDTGYTVFEISGGGVLTVVCGVVGELHAGESVVCRGKYENHAAYGRQFHAQECETDMPKDLEAVYAFLASGSLPYIGARTANKIIDKFGAQALEMIANDPDQLVTIPGISADKADRIQQEFKRMFGMRELIAYLAQFEISPRRAMEVFRVFGPGAMNAISSNPYLLCGEPLQLDFRHADSIAQYYHMEGDCAQRLEAALLRTLRHNAGNGHTCLPRAQLLDTASNFIHQPPEKLAAALDRCLETEELCVRMFDGTPYVYLPDLLAAEQDIADRLALLTRRGKNPVCDLDRNIQVLELTQGFAYAPLQKEAIRKAMTENCLVLTGGPGTGKTTSTRGIVTLLERMGLTVLLLAPTGRAAKRMSELCSREAQTIHRCLGMTFNELTGEVTFKKNEKDLLEADAVIVDEMSMVDLPLMDALLAALKPGCRLVMVGDPDQLPSVGPGNVLGDILRSGSVASVTLTEVFRQAEQSAIIRNAHAVNRGRSPDLKNKQNDFFFLCRRSPDRLVQTVVDLCRTRLPENMGIPAGQIQVLSPTRKGETGTVSLNRALQAALNPPSPGKRQKAWGDMVFRVGDRVMQTKNNYDVIWQKDSGEAGSGIFNGDVGTVEDIDPSGELVTIRFDDRTSVYTADLLSQLDMAYAMTVHKAQGSEYRAVVLVSAPAAPNLLVRGVLYTAITRARELLVMVGDDAIPGRMAENDRRTRRYSGLRRRLKQGGPSHGHE